MNTNPKFRPEVLVVDDEALLRMYAMDVLEANGFAALEACDAEQALLVMEETPGVRLVFTDVQMSGTRDGFGLAQEVRRRWPSVLLLVTSGRIRPSGGEIPAEGRFISKPYSDQALIDEVNEMLGDK